MSKLHVLQFYRDWRNTGRSNCKMSFQRNALTSILMSSFFFFLTQSTCSINVTAPLPHLSLTHIIYPGIVQLKLWSPRPRWLHAWTWRPGWSFRGSSQYSPLPPCCRRSETLKAAMKQNRNMASCYWTPFMEIWERNIL